MRKRRRSGTTQKPQNGKTAESFHNGVHCHFFPSFLLRSENTVPFKYFPVHDAISFPRLFRFSGDSSDNENAVCATSEFSATINYKVFYAIVNINLDKKFDSLDKIGCFLTNSRNGESRKHGKSSGRNRRISQNGSVVFISGNNFGRSRRSDTPEIPAVC